MSTAHDDDYPSAPPPRKRRWLRTLGTIFLVGLLGFIGEYLVRSWLADRELQAAVEEVDRRDSRRAMPGCCAI